MEDFNDCRTVKDFRLTTFSGYQKTKVRDEFIKNLRERKIEPACYWTAEMVASGHFPELWEACFLFFTQCIHLANPKIVLYLRERYGLYYQLSESTQTATGSQISPLELRNNKSIRTLFTEIVCVLSLSPRKPTLTRAILPTSRHLMVEIKPIETQKQSEIEKGKPNLDYLNAAHILGDSDSFSIEPETPNTSTRKKNNDKKQYLFHPSFMMDRVSAPSTNYYRLKRPKDPEEWFVALNEFSYQLSEERRNLLETCFWLEWMIEYDSYCRTHHKDWAIANAGSTKVNKGASRTELIDGLVIFKYNQDMSWAIWEILLTPTRTILADSLAMKLLKNAHILFCVDYTTASCSKKRFWFYYAISLHTETLAGGVGNEKIIQDEYREIIQRVIQKTDDVYQEIKGAEQRPTTDYLMAGVRERNHREDTVNSLKAMESVDMFQLNSLHRK
jgi:hypothetical protein